MVLVGHSMGGAVIWRPPGARTASSARSRRHAPRRRRSEDPAGPTRRWQAGRLQGTTTSFIRQYLLAPTTPPAVADRVLAATTGFPPEIALSALQQLDPKAAPGTMRSGADRGRQRRSLPHQLRGQPAPRPQFEALIAAGSAATDAGRPTRFGARLDEALAKVEAYWRK
jgi:hypothetical protein